MTPLRRVGLASLLLVLLALNLACPNPPPDPVSVQCSSPAVEATIEGLDVTSVVEVGGQGITMVVTRIEWLGAEAPTCASASLRLLDRDGVVHDTLVVPLETVPSPAGRRAASSAYFFLSTSPCAPVVEVTSYGHTVRVDVADSNPFWCPPPDGGVGDGG